MMDYRKMKVAELKELAVSRNIDIGGMKKPDLIAALEKADEPIEVEAKVVENELAVPSKTLEIDSNSLIEKVGEITDAIDELAKVKSDMDATDETIAAMSLEEVGICKKALSDAIKAADEKRLEFGRILRKPIELVNAKCKELTKEAEELNDRYKAREQEAEEERKADKKQELREHYEAFAGVLLDVVPYDKLHDDKWLNKTCNIETAKGEIEAKVSKICSEWESIKALNLEFADDAEARFFDTLDMGEAIAWAGKLAEDKRKIEAMKAELEPEPVVRDSAQDEPPASAYEPEIVDYESAPVTCEADEYAPPISVYGEPEPAQPTPVQADGGKQAVLTEISTQLERFDKPKLENLLAALKQSATVSGAATQRVMVIDAATQEQLGIIGKFCGLVGVTGTFKHGTLAEVVERECQAAAQRAQQGVYGYGG